MTALNDRDLVVAASVAESDPESPPEDLRASAQRDVYRARLSSVRSHLAPLPADVRGKRLLHLYVGMEAVVLLTAAVVGQQVQDPATILVALAWFAVQAIGARKDIRAWAIADAGPTLRRAKDGAAVVALAALLGLAPTQHLALVYAAVVAGSLLARGVPVVAGSRPGRARAVLVGTHADVEAAVHSRRHSRVRLLGYVEPDEALPGCGEISGVPRLGALQEITEVLGRVEPDQVVVLPQTLDPEEIQELSWRMEGQWSQLVVALEVENVEPHRLFPVRHALGLGVGLRTSRPWRRGLPRAVVDRIVAAALLTLMVPVFAVIALLIRVDSLGPAFFVQPRVGKDGRIFPMIKFRTMRVDAEHLRAELVSAEGGENMLFKMARDPRVTHIGRRLRASSLDELPQLLNVLRGEMSLIGPRPALPAEVDQYDDRSRRRLAVTPGMTGLWQVSGRSNLTWSESLGLDLDYVDNWSASRDVEIAVRTVKAVISHDGAY